MTGQGGIFSGIRLIELSQWVAGPMMAKMMADLGSRRLTQERLLVEQRYDAGNGDS